MIELNDATILVSFRIDSPERLENLKTTYEYLKRNFSVPLFYAECDKEPNKEFIEWSKDKHFHYEFYRDFCEVFHRTKFTNYLLKRIKWDIVINWDVDCVVIPENVEWAVEMAKQGMTQVNPYGEFECFNAIHEQKNNMPFMRTLNINDFPKGQDDYEITYNHPTWGGVVVWNRKKYLEIGGENENLIGYTPDDRERIDRIKTLGLGYARTGGLLYHLWHPRGITASNTNPYFKKGMIEWGNVKGMTRNQLQKYIDTWGWK